MTRILLFLFIASFFLSSILDVANAQIYTTQKLIAVDLGQRMLYAWDGGHIVNQTPVTIGLPYTPTKKGIFHVYWKLDKQDMRGDSKWYGPYNIKDVPNVMYFYQDYAIHGAYWRTSFGNQGSHGCVNEPVAFSKWLYDWAPVGTTVYIF